MYFVSQNTLSNVLVIVISYFNTVTEFSTIEMKQIGSWAKKNNPNSLCPKKENTNQKNENEKLRWETFSFSFLYMCVTWYKIRISLNSKRSIRNRRSVSGIDDMWLIQFSMLFGLYACPETVSWNCSLFLSLGLAVNKITIDEKTGFSLLFFFWFYFFYLLKQGEIEGKVGSKNEKKWKPQK